MTSTAYVFPGQGSQRVGMGRDLFDESARARHVFKQADEALGFPLSRICFDGPADSLKQTLYAQPAVFVVSLAALEAAREWLGETLPRPRMVAGHSLGEYTALVAAGAMDLADGVRLVSERGRLMQEAGEKQPGGMTAVLGMDLEALQGVCRDANVEIANVNCPGQVVISGAKTDLENASRLGQARGGKRFLPLEVSGAFHSRWMSGARDGLERAMGLCPVRALETPLVANTSAREIASPAEVREEILAQLSGCVRWQSVVEHMLVSGVSSFIEFGPGQVLTGLVKRTSKDARTQNFGSVAEIRAWTP